jgi:hypothetical protein
LNGTAKLKNSCGGAKDNLCGRTGYGKLAIGSGQLAVAFELQTTDFQLLNNY